MNRFVSQNDVAVDTATGLMWTTDASLSEFPIPWSDALDFVKELNHTRHCGFTDWKLPNRKELFSLMSHEAINPSLPPGHPFVNVFNSYYWTSTSCARLPDQASQIAILHTASLVAGGVAWFLATYAGPAISLVRSPFQRRTNFVLAAAYLCVLLALAWVSSHALRVEAAGSGDAPGLIFSVLRELVQPFRW
jgi:hypothetical protein